MAIRDVSKEWALMLESEADADKRYGDACDEACKKMKELEEKELNDIDEVEVDPVECGFSEEEVDVNEVVDPLQLWKDSKAKQKPVTVKVDAAYIETMRKLLSKIRSSKAQMYNNVMKKLAEYRKQGTELPPPEDYAENFVPFEQIQSIMSAGKTKEERDAAKADARKEAQYAAAGVEQGDDDDSIDADDDTESMRNAEFSDVNNAFGNDMADQNLYDSELTEAEEQKSQEKAKEELKSVQGISSSKLADEFKANKSKIEKAISSIKDEKTKENLKKLMKLAEKYANGELDEADEQSLDEASSKKKSPGKKSKTKTGSFIAGVMRFLLWVGSVLAGGLAFDAKIAAWIFVKIGKIAETMSKGLDDANSRLAESISLECADDDEALEERDADELDECGNPVEDNSPEAMIHQGKSIAEWAKLFKGEFTVQQLARMALSGTDLDQLLLATEGTSDIYDSEKEIEEADYREKASHLLDPVGVKASTASLKAQDTAMISVVETLLKKIDRLEEKIDVKKKAEEKLTDEAGQLDEAVRKSLADVDNSVAHCIKEHISELTPAVLQNREHAVELMKAWLEEAGINSPASRKYIAQISYEPKFRNVNNIISYLVNIYQAGCGLASTSYQARERHRMMHDSEDSKQEVLEDDDFFLKTPAEYFAEGESEDGPTGVKKLREDEELVTVNDATPEEIESTKRKFRTDLDKLEPEELAKVMNNVFNRIAVSLQKEKEAGGDPNSEHERTEVLKAVKRMKSLMMKDRDNIALKDPETREDVMQGLTQKEREEFSDLVYKYWYDWIKSVKKTPEGETVEVPLMSVKDWLDNPDAEIKVDPKTHELVYTTHRQFVGPGYSYMPIGVGSTHAFRTTRRTKNADGNMEGDYTLEQPAVIWKEKKLKTDMKRAERIANKEKQDAIDRGEFAPEEIDTMVNTWKKTFGPVSKKVRQSIEQELKDEEVYGGIPMSDKDKADFISTVKSKGGENAFIQWLFNMFEEPEYATSIKNFKSDVRANYWKSKVQRLKDAVKAKTKEIDDKVAAVTAEYKKLQDEKGDLTPEQQEKHAEVAEEMSNAWEEQ